MILMWIGCLQRMQKVLYKTTCAVSTFAMFKFQMFVCVIYSSLGFSGQLKKLR